MKATKKQKQLISINAPTKDIKEEFVQWATKDVKKTSCNDLNFEQANKILEQLGLKPHKPEYWATFDNNNKKHRVILALMRTAQWVKPHDRYGEVADLDRLDLFLKSDKCPVNKPLQEMSPKEVEKVIKALDGIVDHKFKKKK